MSDREPWLEDSLGYLIGPERVADFLANTYEREALVLTYGQPQRFDGLLSSDDIDRIITQVDLREGQLDLANATNQLRRADYIDSAGFVDRGAVADYHRGGATIILQQLHQMEPSLGRFCRALEHVFSAHVQTNIYLTPPNAQGFRTHYDNHDVFVLQIEGEKAWRLYDKPIDTPYRGEGFESGKHESGALKQEFVLKAGDCAYVPRGMMHDALTAGDAPSLHVTVGLITRTWADLMLEAVAEVALRTPELRRSLPPGYIRADFDRAAARKHLTHLAEIVAREIQLDPALDLTTDTFIRSRPANNRFAVRDARLPVTESDTFRARQHAPFRLAEDGEQIVLISPGGELTFKPDQRAALDRVLNGAPFKAADVGGDAHLIARLLAYGLIART